MIALVAAAAGIAAGIGAAQLGLGYGLGVVVWPVTSTTDDGVWLGSLCWATWIAAGATVFGAVAAARLDGAPRPVGPWRLALVAAAAIGAVVTVALVALPARDAVRVDTYSPLTIAAGYAIVGILLGMAFAYWAVVSRPVAANLLATAVWLWALPVAAVAVDLIAGRPSPTYLTSWQFADPGGSAWYGTFAWPDTALTLLAAMLIGAGAAWPAVRVGRLDIGTAASGAVGPLLVAAVFFVQAPQLGDAPGPIGSAYLTAPYAVLAGLAGSAAAVAVGRWESERQARRTEPIALEPILVARGSSPVVSPADTVSEPPAEDYPPPEDAPPATGTGPAVDGQVPPPAIRARSTVARPPAQPSVAKINPPR